MKRGDRPVPALFPSVERLLVGIMRRERLTVESYRFLVTSLFGTLVGYMSLVVAGVLLTSISFAARPSLTNGMLLIAMCIVAVLRILLVIGFRRWQARKVRATVRDFRDVVRWEALYAVIGVAMMFVVGTSSALSAAAHSDESSLVVSIIITMGIAGCIPGRNGSRPMIVAVQIVGACLPFTGALLYLGTRPALLVAALTLVFFAAALSSTKAQYISLKTAISNEVRARGLARSVQRSATMLDTALNTMSSGLLMFDDNLRLVVANDRVKAMWGTALIEPLLRTRIEAVARSVLAAMGASAREAVALRRQVRGVIADGSERTLVLADTRAERVYDLRLSQAAAGGLVAIVDDVTEKHRKDAEIHRLAHRDMLTGMANRFDLHRQMRGLIARATPSSPAVAMFIDLDGFKAVNDYFGHAVGDELLVRVSQRIAAQTRRSDPTARIGGDEFVVCFRDAPDKVAVAAAAQRLIDEISRPYDLDGKVVEIGASAGLASVEKTELSPEDVLRAADVALYEAKSGGRGRAVWFRAEFDDRARKHREMTLDLRKAIEGGELVLHYQPVVDSRTGAIVCCEALARWTSPTRGVVPPSVFIPLAEETDLIHALSEWSLTQACRDALAWPDERIKVAVNLSAAHFKQGNVARRVIEIASRCVLPLHRLEIEITESTLARDLDSMKFEMDTLGEAGISIALDDFGMGYSSLSYLHSLPIQKVKLDGSFVKQLDTDPSAVALIASIVQMTNTMRKELVIEQVETAEQLLLVGQAQARLIQGYYYSRPLPQAEIVRFIAAGARPTTLPAQLKRA